LTYIKYFAQLLPLKSDVQYKNFPDKNTLITFRESNIVPEHAVKAYGRMEVQFCFILTLVLDGHPLANLSSLNIYKY
jgi:hypothetical protein